MSPENSSTIYIRKFPVIEIPQEEKWEKSNKLYIQEMKEKYPLKYDDSQLSWGVDVWCTDAHTITDLEGNPVNYAESIEIGRHVWVGKDVKIGKNVRIADNSIVGWGSIVTKRFDEPNVILAGTPAKIVKRGINWDRKCMNKYAKGL